MLFLSIFLYNREQQEVLDIGFMIEVININTPIPIISIIPQLNLGGNEISSFYRSGLFFSKRLFCHF